MGKISFTLPNGLESESEIHKDVEMREITAGDILTVNEQCGEIYMMPSGSPALMYPTDKVMAAMICRIVTKLGSLKMPLSRQEFNKLSAADFDFLMDKYFELREKSNLDAAGRDNQPL